MRFLIESLWRMCSTKKTTVPFFTSFSLPSPETDTMRKSPRLIQIILWKRLGSMAIRGLSSPGPWTSILLLPCMYVTCTMRSFSFGSGSSSK